MSNFSFSSTAQCNYCGQLLANSDEECDNCSEDDIYQQMFRKIVPQGGEPNVLAVKATHQYKWYKLESEVGEDWKKYEWLGPRESVQKMVGSYSWDTIEDIPKRSMSLDAPNDVGE